MRHRVAHRKLGRVTEHRVAMLRNQAQALLRHERIETTVPRAKELRPFVERIITIAKRGLAAGAGDGRAVTARRLVHRDIADKAVVSKLFDTIAPRFAERPGGYTRILRLGARRGDAAEVAQVELVGSEYNPKAAARKPEEAEKAKGVGGRLRAAADRLRGKREKPAESDEAKEARAARAEAAKAKSASAARSKASQRGAGSKKMG
jgi:large subunit ribosomal protein L17